MGKAGDLIAVQNRSTVATEAEVRLWTRACGIQLRRDIAPAWRMKPVGVQFVPRTSLMPSGAWPVYVLDDSDMQGALGYHTTDNRGVPYARVFGRTCLQFGLPICPTLSHEVAEAFVDPNVDQWRNGYAVEVGDPVEADSYRVGFRFEEDEGRVYRVPVSDFAYPSWWEPNSRGPWDHMHKAPGPLQLAKGGYAMTTSGTIFAAEYPEWRKWVKITDGSRTLRMIAEAAPEHQELRNELAALDRAA